MKPALYTAAKNKKITYHMGKAGLEPINLRRIEGPPKLMQPKSLQKAKRVAYNLRFSLIRLNYKAKMQLYEAKQAKKVVTESINRPRTKKIDDSFFGFW